MPFPDLSLLAKADADSLDGLRGRWRTLRRLIKRSIIDRKVFEEAKFFCQNSGACGSHYIVDLLIENGVERVFHEKEPDLNELGVQHFDSPVSKSRMIQTLRYTRHNVFFEANNRLFSFSRELSTAFPNAGFIHLFRHPAHAVRSAMSKPDVATYLDSNVRFSGTLGGTKGQRPLERFCFYWKNINQRILDDLLVLQESGVKTMWLEFDDLVSGRVDQLEKFLDRNLRRTRRSPSNVGAVRKEGKFDTFENWSSKDKETLNQICLPLFESLRSKATEQTL
jgi:hypothetical protein